jgi:predicted ATPase
MLNVFSSICKLRISEYVQQEQSAKLADLERVIRQSKVCKRRRRFLSEVFCADFSVHQDASQQAQESSTAIDGMRFQILFFHHRTRSIFRLSGKRFHSSLRSAFRWGNEVSSSRYVDRRQLTNTRQEGEADW